MALDTRRGTGLAAETVFVDRFCDGIIGPGTEVLGTVRDGGHIVANTAPGCWGPMITPAIKGGHEVTLPVAVEGAEVGDAIAIRIRDITVTSLATSSGHDRIIAGRFNGDPYCAKVCPGCGTADEPTVLEGIGEDAVRCASCGAVAAPFAFANGYTIAFDDDRTLGVTVGREQAEAFARDADRVAALPAALHPAPDPDLRAARPRRPRGAPAAVHGPARDDAGRRHARLAQRRRLRRLPARGAARPRADGRGARAPHRRPHGHRRRARRRDRGLPGQGRGRRRLPRRHARAAGRRRDRRPHRRRLGHRRPCRCTCCKASPSTGRCCCRWPRTCRSWPSP